METYEDLGAVLGPVDVDSEALIARAVRDGRRHERRRRLGVGAAALAVVAVGTGLQLGSSHPADLPSVAGDPTTTATPSTTGTSGLPSPALTDERLAARLPTPGNAVSATDTPAGVDVERTLDPDGAGAGSVTLVLSADKPLTQREIADATDKCHSLARLNGPESCKAVDGGWVFTLAEQPSDGNAPPRSLHWSATLVSTDGTSVALAATNFLEKGTPTRQTPVLDFDQLGHLVLDPVWFSPAS